MLHGANEAFDTLIFLEDNGEAQNGKSRDRIGFSLVPDSPAEQDAGCVAPVQSPAMMPLTQGDFTIHDAP